MYLDSAVLVKLVVREPDSWFYAERTNGQAHVCSSELALTECWSALCRKRRQGEIDKATWQGAGGRLQSRVQDQTLRLQPVNEAILRRANRLIERCHMEVSVRTLDAIHLATCDALDACPIFTNDTVMRKAARALGMELGPMPEGRE